MLWFSEELLEAVAEGEAAGVAMVAVTVCSVVRVKDEGVSVQVEPAGTPEQVKETGPV
jgi:hypothetical protein